MEFLRIYELDQYARLVNRDEAERTVLDSLLRLTITRFFRNSWLWEELGALISKAAVNLEGNKTLRVWCAG